MVFGRILRVAPPGTVIPKPKAKSDFIVKGLGKRRGEQAIVYVIPSHTNPPKPHEKGVTVSEVERAYREFVASGEFTRQWFVRNLPRCYAEGDCNFTTTGGLFVLLGEAEYAGRGVYRRSRRDG